MATYGKVSSNDYEGRFITFSWELISQDAKANTSTILWRLEGAGDSETARYKAGNFKVVIDGTTVYSTSQDNRIWLYNGTVVAAGNYTFTHNSQGLKSFVISIQAGINTYEVNCRGEGGFSLPNITRASIIDTVNGNDTGDNLSVSYTSNVSSYINNLIIELNGAELQAINDYKSDEVFLLSVSALNAIYTATATSKIVNLTFTLETYDDTNPIGTSTVNKALNVSDSEPTIGLLEYIDTNNATIAVTANNKYIVRNKSTLQVTVSNLTAIHDATLATLTLTGGGINITRSLSGTSIASEVIDVGVVNQSSDFTLIATLTDSRGNTASESINVNVYDYIAPKAVIAAVRQDNYYSSTKITVNATYSSIGNHNTLTITERHKKTTDQSYSAPTTLMDGVETTINLDNAYNWDVKITVADALSSTVYNLVINKGLPLCFIDKKLNSIGVNCFPKDAESLEVSGVNILNALRFKAGDTETITTLISCGAVSDNSTKVTFSIPLSKSYAGLTVSVTSLALDIRDVSGSLTQINEAVGTYTITLVATSDNILTLTVEDTNGFNINNNTPVAVSITTSISFT